MAPVTPTPPPTGAILLVGGRSTRMGTAKAALDWHGEPLACRVARVLARAVADGPVVAVGAPGQQLPAMSAGVEVIADPAEGDGPLRGLAAGLAHLSGRADVAYVSSVDAPLLHARFVAAVLAGLGDHDAAVPIAHGHRHPLAAAYRLTVLPLFDRLLAEGERRLAVALAQVRTRLLDETALRTSAGLGQVDPLLDALRNVNTPDEYEQVRALLSPEVTIEVAGAPGRRASFAARASRLGEAVVAAGLALDGHVVATIDGGPPVTDPWYPLGPGDRVALATAGT